jgi:hypothetical protein
MLVIEQDVVGFQMTDDVTMHDMFTSVFSHELPGEVPTKGVSPHSAVPDINITASGVLKLLRNINPNKATGPDTIPGRLLKELATEITPAQDVVGFQMTDDVTMHDMFHDLAANRSQRYWSVVGSYLLS